jgi:hypothetical protein
MGRYIVRTPMNKSVTRLNLPTFIYTNLKKHETIQKTNTTLTCVPIEHYKLGNAGILRSPEIDLCHLWKAGKFPDGGFPTSDLCRSRGIHQPLTLVSGRGIPELRILHPATSKHRNIGRCHVKCPLLLSSFNHNWNVSTNFSRTPQHGIWFHEEPFNPFSSSWLRMEGQRDFHSRAGLRGS